MVRTGGAYGVAMAPARVSLPAGFRHPVVLDGLAAAVLLVLSLHALWNPTPLVDLDFRDADALGVVLTVVGCAGIVLRRRLPVVALVVTLVATLVHAALTYSQGVGSFAPLLPLYSVAVVRPFRTSLTLALATAAAVASVLAAGPYEPTPGDWASNLLVCLGAWGVGRSVRSKRAHARSVEQRNRAVQEAREAETRTLLVEERSRTAREMQDLVAHNLTEVSVQIAAARRVMRRDPDAAEELLLGAEHTGRAALEEMRRAGGVLGEHTVADLRPQPGLADLPRLLEEERTAGLRISHDLADLTGSDGVPAGLQLTVFRLVEEALHQARTRSGRMPVEVLLAAAGDRLRVTVTSGPDRDTVSWEDTGAPAGSPLHRLRDRAAAYGGELTLGRRRDGSFRLEAEFPLAATSPATSSPATTETARTS